LVEHLRSVDHALSRATASSLIDLNLHVPSRLGTTIAVVRPRLRFRITYPKQSRASIFRMKWPPALASLKWHEFVAVDVTAPIMSNSAKELPIHQSNDLRESIRADTREISGIRAATSPELFGGTR
jgi:hypothetical protein